MSSENKAEFTYLAEKSQRELDFVNSDLKAANNSAETEAVLIDRGEALRAKLHVTTKQAKPLIGEPSGDVKSKDLHVAIAEHLDEKRVEAEEDNKTPRESI